MEDGIEHGSPSSANASRRCVDSRPSRNLPVRGAHGVGTRSAAHPTLAAPRREQRACSTEHGATYGRVSAGSPPSPSCFYVHRHRRLRLLLLLLSLPLLLLRLRLRDRGRARDETAAGISSNTHLSATLCQRSVGRVRVPRPPGSRHSSPRPRRDAQPRAPREPRCAPNTSRAEGLVRR